MDYLLKTEPSTYSFADLQREKTTVWDGVSNPVAVKNLAGMECGAEFPGVRQENSHDFSRLYADTDQAKRETLNDFSVFAIGEAPPARGVDNGCLGRVSAARIEYQIGEKAIAGVCVEFGPQHAGRIVAEICKA